MKTANPKIQHLDQLFRRVAREPSIKFHYTGRDAAKDGVKIEEVKTLAAHHGLRINRAGLLVPDLLARCSKNLDEFSSRIDPDYFRKESQRLAAENRELRATLRRRDCDIALYQAATLVAVLGCILLAMEV